MQRSSIFRLTGGLTAAAALCAGTLAPFEADARGRGIGAGIGIGAGVGAGLMLLNEAAKAANINNSGGGKSGSSGSSRSRSKNSDDDDDKKADNGSDKSSKQKSAEERAADARNHAALQTEYLEITRTEQLERERNVQQAVRRFVSKLEDWHKWLRDNKNANVRMSSGTNINQVTDGEVKRAVEDAYKAAQLYEFERMAGEIWTRDRLLVRILDRSQKELDDYFQGVGVKGTSMADLQQVFDRSAKHVHGQALQIAELIGVSYSFDRFIRTIFEQSDRTDESLWTIGADGHYELLIAGLVDSIPRQSFISDDQVLSSDRLGLDKQFTFRFRARRALYDCMSVRYAELIGSGGDGAAIPVAAQGDGSARPALAQGDAAATEKSATTPSSARPAALGDRPTVWSRLREAMNTVCRQPLGAVLSEVKNGRIQPKPARWDSGGADMVGRRNPVIPAQSGNPFR